MKIKVTYSLHGMHVSRETDLPAHFDGEGGTEFLLWIREVEHQGQTVRQLCSDVVSDVEPPSRARDTLLALKENRLLLDDPIQEGLPQTSLSDGTIVDLQGNIKPNWAVDFDLLPKGAKPWLRQVKSRLSGELVAFIKQLRWSQNSAGGHRPYAVVGTYWSTDGKEWNHFPSEFSVNISQPRPIEMSGASRGKMAEIVNKGAHEPIAHDLMREAGELMSRTPRSALLVAFAALETGIKIQLVRMIPDASALIDKMPSPPLVTLLQEVLPKTIAAKGLPAAHFPLKKDAKDYLRKWVTQRNQVTHGLKHSVDANSVEEFIRFAKDILYLLDDLDGQNWALTHLESEFWTIDESEK
tara:strand:- start:259 stop:1320 length:1062 start_codon:yes stop_codon:yes gene_type:complete